MKKSLYIRIRNKALGLLVVLMPYFFCATAIAGSSSQKADYGFVNPSDTSARSFSAILPGYKQNVSGTDIFQNSIVSSSQYTLKPLLNRNSKPNFILKNALAPDLLITCPGDKIVNTDSACYAHVGGLDATLSGSITTLTWIMVKDGTTTASSPISGINNILGTFLFEGGTTTITYWVTDSFGNKETCNFTVVVNDVEPPTIVCPSNANITIPSCATLTVPIKFSPQSIKDNCGVDNFSSSPPLPAQFSKGITNITWTAVDPSGNTATCVQKVNVTSDPPLSGTITNQLPVACTGTATGSVTVAGSGGTPPYLYSINGVTYLANGQFNNLSAGNYTIFIKDANNCLFGLAVTITEAATALTAVISSHTNVLCSGQATGTATVTVSGGTAPYTYSWNTVPAKTTAIATGLAAGTYTVTVTDVAGCIKTATVNITQPAALTISITKTDVSCFGDSTATATAVVSGGTPPYRYTWLTVPPQTTAIATHLPAGNYTLAVFDANDCFKPAFITISQPAKLTATFTQVNVACAESNTGSITVTASGGVPPYQYNLNGAAFQASGTFNNLAAGTYAIIARDANSCSVNLTVTITAPAAALTAVITSHTNVLCSGQATGTATVTVSGGTAPYTYSWNTVPAKTTATATGLTAGTYTVTVTDVAGCTKTATVNITQPTALTINISKTDVSCFGDSTGTATAVVSGGTPPYRYTWLTVPPQTTAIATHLPAGSYTLAVFDANDCFKPAFVIISQPVSKFTASFTQVNVACAESNTGSITVTGSGGVPPYQYNLNGGTFQASGTFNNLAGGTYAIIARDANSCSVNLTVTITAPVAALTAVITSHTNVLCSGQATGTATVTASGGTAPYTYSWNTVPAKPTATATGLSVGTYTVTVTDFAACTQTATVNITQPAALTINISKTDVSCFGDSTGTATAVVSGGTPPYRYTWLTVPPQTTAIATHLPAGSYTLAVFDANDCFKPAFITISQPAKLITTYTQADVACAGNTGSITVSGNGGTPPYLYNINGGTFQASGIFDSLSAGVYTIITQDAHNCTFSLTATITEPANALHTTITQTNVLCFGQANGRAKVTAVNGTLPYSYKWHTITEQTTDTITDLPAGNYRVTTTDGAGCSVTDTAFITEPLLLAGLITNQVNFDCASATKGSVTVVGTGGTPNYQYSIDGGMSFQVSGTFPNLTFGNYTIIVRDTNNCESSVPVQIIVDGLILAANDDFTTPEDIPLNDNVMANDRVLCNLPITVTANTAPQHGSVLVNPDGSFTYVPSLNYNGNDFFNYTITDNVGSTSTATVSIDIAPVNDPPVTFNDSVTVHYNLAASGNILLNGDYDPEGTVLTVTTTPILNAAHGTFVIAADGNFTYTPSLNYIGTDMVIVSICDAGIPLPPACTSDTIHFIVLPPNQPPLTIHENIDVCQEGSFTGTKSNGGTVFNGDTDPENNLPLTLNSIPVEGPAHGTFSITDPVAGTFNYSPNSGYAGNDYVIVSICDSGIPVECSNDTIFIQVVASTIADAGLSQKLCNSDVATLVGNSATTGTGSWTYISGPSVPAISPSTGNVANVTGLTASTTPYIFEYSIHNGTCSTTDTMSVMVYAPATPSFAGTDQDFCNGAGNLNVTLAGNTPINGTGSWSQLAGPTLATIEDVTNPNTAVTDLSAGMYTFEWLISNGVCAPSADVVTITVYSNLVADAGTNQIIPAGTSAALSGTVAGGSGSYSWSWQPSNLLVNSLVENPVTVPLISPTTFTLTVLDLATLCTDDADVIISIDNTGNFVAVADYDTTLVNVPGTINVLNNDLNPDNKVLTVSICGDPLHGIVVLNSDNTITYTPNSGYEGDDEICYRICSATEPLVCSENTVFIHVKLPGLEDLFPYNGVSTNNDGINDVWKIKGIEKYPDNTVIIFNRWGDKLREFANYNNTTHSWDGKNEHGDPMPDGTYFYILDVKNVGVLKGWIFLRGK